MLVCQVVLDPLIFQIEFVEFGLISHDSLVPHDDGVSLSFLMLEFANDREEADVCVPVEQSRDVSFQVKLEFSNVLVVVLIIDEHVHVRHLEVGVLDDVGSIITRQVIQKAHSDHPSHHVVEHNVKAIRQRIHLVKLNLFIKIINNKKTFKVIKLQF